MSESSRDTTNGFLEDHVMFRPIRFTALLVVSAALATLALPKGSLTGVARADPPALGDDEKAIRELVANPIVGQKPKRTENSIHSSGLTPKPLVGREEQE